ncbi:cellulase family glycosylhydrolase [Pyxidicoccus fallax]|uniref:Glycoside hydrolase family 5 protein n=1 Tax=Pyxidicoccus fallax TaxID=394095 RepID=A0A848L4Q3_9BACT|nr:cellulase family glycosylhydrolase [Pyxidicoccus fallax]NMO13950.1 glycoside hydrolase family 5 protein [Pyxidicoccus fallax]NPC78349.1 cellulase family glycosylhydrolase [Pyxidicoccus fallax]
MHFRANNWVSLSALLLLLVTPLTASAVTFVNRGAQVGPRDVSSGQTVGFFIGIQSPEAVANVTLHFEIRPYNAATGVISSSAVYRKTVTGQNFASGETKEFNWGYTIDSNMVTGDYLWFTRATNATGSVVYFEAGRIVSNYTFHVNGVPAKRYVRGINLMDLGNAGGVLPGTYGTTYSKPSYNSLRFLKDQGGHTVVRIPFIWERIQPELGKPLNAQYLDLLLQTLKDANAAGLKVIVDMHNYGHYTNRGGVKLPFGAAGAPTPAQYAQAWSLIAAAIKAVPEAAAAVYAYDIMNEPHDLLPAEGTLLSPVSISNFETGTQGWLAQASESVVWESRNAQGSLKLTGTGTADHLVFGARLYASTQRTTSTQGRSFQAKVFVPTSTPGFVRARMVMSSSDWSTNFFSEEFPITKGVEHRVYFTPDATLWTTYRALGIQFIVDGTTGTAPHVFYVDQLNQGTRSGNLTAAQQWERYSQEVVNTLRNTNKDTTLVMVEGYSWASAEQWPTHHPRKWITDSANNIMYHAHIYMDSLDFPEYPDDGGGKYRSAHSVYLAEARRKGHASVGAYTISRVKPFTDWVAAQGTQGFIGEYGWPSTQMKPGDNGAWEADGDEFLRFLDGIGMGATMWASGSWEKLPACNILNAYELEPRYTRLSQAAVLERHPGKP